MSSYLRELGQHAVVGIAGPRLEASEKQLLRQIQPFSVILFRKNIDNSTKDWVPQLQTLIADIYDAAATTDILISIDHEGGLVHRLFDPVTQFPAALNWGQNAAKVGKAMGQELSALGFQLNFAPVLDCWSEPLNTVIGQRAFSKQPEQCGKAAIEFARAMESQGVLACGKHFPGHGATIIDSHHGLPFLENSVQEIEQCELIPFKEYISCDFPLIMTSHVVYTALDPDFPATISEKITAGLLRKTIGYDKVVITDDLEMKALQDYTSEEIAVSALRAGADLLLEGNPAQDLALKRLEKMLGSVAKAIDSGELSADTIEKSQQRIKNLRNYQQKLSTDCQTGKIDTLGCQNHQALKEELTPDS